MEGEDNLLRSGVYAIRNSVNGKVYVGSTVNFKRRWQIHRIHLSRGSHHSVRLQNAWNKYGSAAFEWIVLEIVPETTLLTREQFWLDHFQSAEQYVGYNVSPTARSVLGIKRSPETKEKISAAHTGMQASEEARRNMSLAATGKIVSLEAKIKMRLAGQSGFRAFNKGKEMSRSQKAKISESLRRCHDDPDWIPSPTLIRVRERRAEKRLTDSPEEIAEAKRVHREAERARRYQRKVESMEREAAD